MTSKIGRKLFVVFLGTMLVVLGVGAALTRWSFERGFFEYVEDTEGNRLRYFASRLTEAYASEGGWEHLKGNQARWLELMQPPFDDAASSDASTRSLPAMAHEGRPTVVSRDPLAVSPRITVLDAQGERLFGLPPAEKPARVEPIVYQGELVGTLLLNPLDTLASDLDIRFAAQQTRWIYGSAVLALLLAATASALLTRQLIGPIRRLTAGTRALAAGHFDKRITIDSHDELSELAGDFNLLAETLERDRRAQKQWIADISHELRTPLSILRGELHAVEDGVRAFDRRTQQSLSTEVDRLTKLVDDLYELAISDAGALQYQKENIDIVSVLREVIELFETRFSDAGLKVETDLPETQLTVWADPTRIAQLFTNLLENTLRYTDSGGTVRISSRRDNRTIVIDIEDSSPGVPEDCLPKLFDRLYRLDESRSRKRGGAGLGLAICKSIVEAHSAEIEAAGSRLGGLRVRLRFSPTARGSDESA